jgi:hypothetical protein
MNVGPAIFLCASLLLSLIGPSVSRGIVLPDPSELSVGIATFGPAKRRVKTFRHWLEEGGVGRVHVLSLEDVHGGGLDGVDLLIVPRAADLPLELWRHLPEYHARGGHLLFEGVPLATGHLGSEKFVPGIGPDLHLYYEQGHLPGLPGDRQTVTLRAHESLEAQLAFEPRTLRGEGGARRSIQKWVRRYERDTTGQIEFRDDIEFTPFAFYDVRGRPVAQQAVLVRHHCRLFNGASTIFVDLSVPERVDHGLLDRSDGPEILSVLVRLAFARLPGERAERDYEAFLELKAVLSELRDRFVEAEYLARDIDFLLTNGAEVPRAPGTQARFRSLSDEVMPLIDAFNHWRNETTPKAWKQYGELRSEGGALLARIVPFLAEQRALLDGLLDLSEHRDPPLPGGELVYGFASTRVRWGFKDHYMLRAMKEAGMESYTDWRFDADTLKRLGLTRISLYELLHPMPRELEEQLASRRGRAHLDLDSGELRFQKDRVNPVLDRAFESEAYHDFLARKARSLAQEPLLNSRIITAEGVLTPEDGYGEFARDRYHEFLQWRHGDIAHLNSRWRTRYGSFDEIELPRRSPSSQTEHANWYDWVDFRAHAVTRYLAKIYEIYHRHDTRHRVVTCFNQASPLDGVDFYAVNAFQDRVSSHNKPTSLPWYLPGLAHHSGQRGENNEIKAPYQPYAWAPRSERGTQWKVRFYTLYSYARGVAEQEEHLWGHFMYGKPGEGGEGILGEVDGFFRLAGAEAKHFHRWKESWEAFSGAKPPHEWAEVGLYWSFATKSHGGNRGKPPRNRGDDLFWSSFVIMNRWNWLLDALQMPFETVPRQKVKAGAIDHLKLIIVPQALYLEEQVSKGLLEYVKRGGELLVVGTASKYDEYGVPRDRLFEAVGVDYTSHGDRQIVVDGRPYTTIQLTPLHNGGASRIRFTSAGDTGEVLYRFEDGGTAGLRVPYGRGAITLLGFSPSGDRRPVLGTLPAGDPLLSLMETLFERAAVDRPVHASDPQVRLATWNGEGGWFYTVVQNYGAEKRTARLRIPGTIELVVDVALRVAVGHRTANGDSLLEIPLLEAGGRVLAWRRPNS